MTQSNAATDMADVVLVGAGVAGLILAIELLRQGVSCRLIDQNHAAVNTSSLLELHPRTLEFLNRFELVEELLPYGQPLYEISAYSQGQRFIHVMLDMSQQHTRYNYILMLPHHKLEQGLRNHFLSLGGEIEYGTKIMGIVQGKQSITLNVQNASGQDYKLQALWVVACDGVQSTVRERLGLPFEGVTTEPALIADVQAEWNMPRASQEVLSIFLSSESAILAYPYNTPGQWRLLDMGPNLAETATEQEIVAQLTRKLREAIGSSVKIQGINGVFIFKSQQKKLAAMRVGRCFFVGESAFSYSHGNIQDINTAVQDAFNLAWKLAFVCKGELSELILDTYQSERGLVNTQVLNNAQFFTNLLSIKETAARQVRDTLVSTIMSSDVTREPFLKRIAPVFSEFDTLYTASPLLAEDWQVKAHSSYQSNGIASGKCVADFPLGRYEDGSCPHLLNMLRDTQYALFLFSGYETNCEQLRVLDEIARNLHTTHGDLVSVFVIISSTAISKQLKWQNSVILDEGHPTQTLHYYFGASGPSLYLIRPDGYVGYRSQPIDETKFFAYLHQLGLKPGTCTAELYKPTQVSDRILDSGATLTEEAYTVSAQAIEFSEEKEPEFTVPDKEPEPIVISATRKPLKAAKPSSVWTNFLATGLPDGIE